MFFTLKDSEELKDFILHFIDILVTIKAFNSFKLSEEVNTEPT